MAEMDGSDDQQEGGGEGGREGSLGLTESCSEVVAGGLGEAIETARGVDRFDQGSKGEPGEGEHGGEKGRVQHGEGAARENRFDAEEHFSERRYCKAKRTPVEENEEAKAGEDQKDEMILSGPQDGLLPGFGEGVTQTGR